MLSSMGIFEWLAEDLLGFEAPSATEVLFILCAVFGALFFILMMGMMFLGGMLDGIAGALDVDVQMDSTTAAEIFSVQGIAAAIMMFGLTGMVVTSSTDKESLAVFAGGLAAVGSLYGMKYMMRGIINLQADGTMKHSDSIGATGTVYSRIKPNEVGEIQVAVDGTLRTLLARAKDKQVLIPRGELVKVIGTIGSTLIVDLLDGNEE